MQYTPSPRTTNTCLSLDCISSTLCVSTAEQEDKSVAKGRNNVQLLSCKTVEENLLYTFEKGLSDIKQDTVKKEPKGYNKLKNVSGKF